MKKQLNAYFKSIKKNLPCVNSAMRKMLADLKLSVDTYIQENKINDFEKILEHFGLPEDIAKEFAIGLDDAYIKSYKTQRRVIIIITSIFAAILVIVASFSIYIYIENERNTPVKYEPTIKYEYSEDYEQ